LKYQETQDTSKDFSEKQVSYNIFSELFEKDIFNAKFGKNLLPFSILSKYKVFRLKIFDVL
jgi:hypothetical protein